jgi:hypothetical protein
MTEIEIKHKLDWFNVFLWGVLGMNIIGGFCCYQINKIPPTIANDPFIGTMITIGMICISGGVGLLASLIINFLFNGTKGTRTSTKKMRDAYIWEKSVGVPRTYDEDLLFIGLSILYGVAIILMLLWG